MHEIGILCVQVYLMMASAFGLGAGLVGGLQQGLSYGLLMGATAPVSLYISQSFAASSRVKVQDAYAPTTYVLSDGSLTISTPNKTALSKWTDWHKAIETKRVIALYPVAGVVQVIPKRQLTAEMISDVKGLLRRVLGGRAKFRGEV